MLTLPIPMMMSSSHTSPSSTVASLSPDADTWTMLKCSDDFASPVIDWSNCSIASEANIFESAFINYPPSPEPTYPDPPVYLTPLMWYEPDPQPPKAERKQPKQEVPRAEPYRPPMQAKIPPEKGKKEFRCIHKGCYMVFSKRNALEQHILTHTGEQPHACEHCNRRFSLKCNLRRHYRTCREAQHNLANSSSSNSSPPPSSSPPSSSPASSTPPFVQ